MSHFDFAMQEIWEFEGEEYTDHPDDNGGATKYGITIGVLSDWRNATRCVESTTKQDVMNLTRDEAERIYKALYWTPMRLNGIEDKYIARAMMSIGVNCGIRASVMSAQRAINAITREKAIVDGIVGPVTLNAINAINPKRFIFEFFKDAQRRYIDICKKNPTQLVFLKGWMNRVNSMLEDFFNEGQKV